MNRVFIATSLDGYIADKAGGIDWLHSVPNPEGIDMGYAEFMSAIDAIIMGRVTYETVLGFGIDWPYSRPVFVLSNKLKSVPDELKDKVFPVSGVLSEILEYIHQKGHHNLYIDGGSTIQSFLNEDLIDEMIITTIPILLGGGFSLFGKLNHSLLFECSDTRLFLGKVVQNRFKRERS